LRVLRTAPRPLLGLLAAILALGIAFTLVTPFLQAPDENSHFGYVQYFGETGQLPGNKTGAPPFTTEQGLASADSNSDQAAAEKAVPMNWSPSAFDAWRASERKLTGAQRADAGGPNPASGNPPLYYLLETPAYLVGKGGDIFTRLELTRIMSVLWILATATGAWLLAGELFGRDRLMQLAVAGFTGLAPMVLFVSSSISPDAMLYAAWAFVLWLGTRLLRRGLSTGGVLALFAAVGAACVVKATSFALMPAAALALGLALWRARPEGLTRRRAATAVGVAAAGLIGTLGIWIVVSRLNHQAAAGQVGVVSSGEFNIREFLSYLWQFYLPKLGFMNDFHSVAPTLPAWDILFKGAWAAFGWLEVIFPVWVYWLLLVVSVGAVVGAVTGLWKDRSGIDWAVFAFLALVVIGLMAGLHISEYRQIKGGASNFFQGRYVLPLAPLAAAALARTIAWAPRRLRGQLVGGALAAFLVLNLFSLGLILQRFYA
jgi:4-amino-4-deoxy-L-arabinose transferase-like glycosyltransferase